MTLVDENIYNVIPEMCWAIDVGWVVVWLHLYGPLIPQPTVVFEGKPVGTPCRPSAGDFGTLLHRARRLPRRQTRRSKDELSANATSLV